MGKKLIILLIGLSFFNLKAQDQWKAPQDAKLLQNPLNDEAPVLDKGEKIFKSFCASCHGVDGTGDPVMVKTMNPPPADLTSKHVQQQTDGEIYWKITEGNGLMASYKSILSEEERWAVVKYIRKLAKGQHVEKLKHPVEKSGEVEAFSFSQLINAKTTHIRQTDGFSLGFGIQHRFGATKFNNDMLKNFFGLDLASNIRFNFEFPVTKKLMFEVGRTRYGKFYDLGGKYLLTKQTGKMPVSIAVYENIAVTTENPPQYSEDATFSDGRKFEYKFMHRLYYDTQLIISRKFCDRFSGEIAAELVWRNLTPATPDDEKAYVIAVPLSFRFKTGLKSAIDLEIMPNTHKNTMPISLAYEIASSGNHVFQITITNSDRLLAQNLFFNPTVKYFKDGFMLGFNLIRYF